MDIKRKAERLLPFAALLCWALQLPFLLTPGGMQANAALYVSAFLVCSLTELSSLLVSIRTKRLWGIHISAGALFCFIFFIDKLYI